jgi:hypothetical protein
MDPDAPWAEEEFGDVDLGDVRRDARLVQLASVLGAQPTALAMHRDELAVPALLSLARQDPNGKVRGDALFWLAQTAGRKVAGDITAAIENDPDTAVKERAVYALSQLPTDEGVPLLINVAKTNRNPAVRKRAMFWLGQSRDPRALAFFSEILK